MLGRASSDAGTRLRRSKSASTVRRPQQSDSNPPDPRIAQQHAVAAASTAFVRARGQTVAESLTKRSSELSRAKSTSSRKSLTSEGSHFPRRGLSDRSVTRPKASQASNMQPPRGSTVGVEKFPSFYPPPPESERPLSTQPSITFGENPRSGSHSRSHRPSVASSITSQQIRKARSMYYASSVQTGSPIARPPAKYLATPPISISPASAALVPTLPVRNAAPSPLASPQIPVTVEPGETIANARDKYLQGFQQQHRQVKHRPSLFLAPFTKRQDRAKSKERPISAGRLSVSTRSRQTPTEPKLESFDDFGMPKQRKEKRSLSNSIKNKLKKVFRRTSNHTDEAIMPVQQIEASRDYFNYEAPGAALSNNTLDIPSPDNETLSRARSRASSLERMPSPLRRPGSGGSIRSRGSHRSLHSETDTTHLSSRVTSWSESSADNTLTQRDIKRLTVIHESKDSISSDADQSVSSFSMRRKTVPLSIFTAFKDPMPMESLLEESTPVNPKRVFSALMKEMDMTRSATTRPSPPSASPGSESDVFESSTTKELHAMTSRELNLSTSRECRISTSSEQRPVSHRRPHTAQSKTSSIKSLSRALKSTIRTVTPNERERSLDTERADDPTNSRPETSTSAKSTQSQKVTTFASIMKKKHTRTGGSGAEDAHVERIVTPGSGKFDQQVIRPNERCTASPDKQAQHEPHHHRTYARNISGSHFTDPAFRTPSTVVGIPALPELEGDSPKETTPMGMRTTPMNLASKSPRLNNLFSPLSPSIYSRNTDGFSILPNESVMSLDDAHNHKNNDESGSALITTSLAVKSYVLGTPSSRHKTESARSSKDWKDWLSREVSELGSPLGGDITISEDYSPTLRKSSPSSRHRREFTQIEADGSTESARLSIDERTSSSPAPTSSEGRIEDAEPWQSTIEERSKTSSVAEDAVENEPVPAVEVMNERPAISPFIRTPAIRKDKHSSAHSHGSARSRSSSNTPKSSTMNDRFPFIDTGRRTSVNSARFSRSSRSATPSGSSTKSKGTPISKVYSDVSAPVTVNRAPRVTSKMMIKSNKHSEQDKENFSEKTKVVAARSKSSRSWQPESTFPSSRDPKENISNPLLTVSSSTLNKNTPSLPESSSTGGRVGSSPSMRCDPAQLLSSSSSLKQQRVRKERLPISPKKLTARPKSAFELRGKAVLPPMTNALQSPLAASQHIPQKWADGSSVRTLDTRASCSGAIDKETLCMLLDSPWAISDPSAPPLTSTDHTNQSRVKVKVRVKHSSSTLALQREPSPGLEARTIDALIEERPLSRRSNFSSVCGDERVSATGRITPGQRMAERYLRARSAPRDNDAVTPRGVVEQKSLRTSATGQPLEREDTPAFL